MFAAYIPTAIWPLCRDLRTVMKSESRPPWSDQMTHPGNSRQRPSRANLFPRRPISPRKEGRAYEPASVHLERIKARARKSRRKNRARTPCGETREEVTAPPPRSTQPSRNDVALDRGPVEGSRGRNDSECSAKYCAEVPK